MTPSAGTPGIRFARTSDLSGGESMALVDCPVMTPCTTCQRKRIQGGALHHAIARIIPLGAPVAATTLVARADVPSMYSGNRQYHLPATSLHLVDSKAGCG